MLPGRLARRRQASRRIGNDGGASGAVAHRQANQVAESVRAVHVSDPSDLPRYPSVGRAYLDHDLLLIVRIAAVGVFAAAHLDVVALTRRGPEAPNAIVARGPRQDRVVGRSLPVVPAPRGGDGRLPETEAACWDDHIEEARACLVAHIDTVPWLDQGISPVDRPPRDEEAARGVGRQPSGTLVIDEVPRVVRLDPLVSLADVGLLSPIHEGLYGPHDAAF